MKSRLIACTLLISFFSINCNTFFKEHQAVQNLKWYREDTKSFDVTIYEEGSYDFIFAFRFATGFPYRTMKIKITQKSSENVEITQDCQFEVVDKNNNYNGDVAGELWDLETICLSKLKLIPGNYTYTISHTMENNPVIMVVDIGLIVKKL